MNAGGGDWKMSDLSSFKSAVGRPDHDQLQGLRHLRDAAADAGLRHAGDAEHPRAVRARSSATTCTTLGPRSAEFWHILIEAKQLAYTDLLQYNGDPRFSDVPVKRLISKSVRGVAVQQDRPRPRARRRWPRRRTPSRRLDHQERGDTVYLTTADRWGNMVSFIYSIYDYFGSQISIPGYGFPMNDRGSFFDLDPSSPNVVAPHKRPFMTIIPAFVMKDGQPLLSFGNMGGDEQAQAQATEIVNMVDLGMNVQAAGDAARFHHGQSPNTVHLESKLYDLVGKQLKAMGHKVVRVAGDDDEFGGYQAIYFQREPGDRRRASGSRRATRR